MFKLIFDRLMGHLLTSPKLREFRAWISRPAPQPRQLTDAEQEAWDDQDLKVW